ncbi:MAG: 3-phosphoshikimate 1-carboxyvinyltransferase [Pseudomonadota bacterium]
MTKQPYLAEKSPPLKGEISVPGDKSISHRALMFALLARGKTRISGLLEGEDVLATAKAIQQLGGRVRKDEAGVWHVEGAGLGKLQEPDDVLDMGNSGTAARLLIGLLSTHPVTTVLTGDHSLRGRPMARVTGPLEATGASFQMRSKGRLPLSIAGKDVAECLTYRLAVASAQVKSAVLLAALNLPGESVVEDPFGTRDHTENMLRHFGADMTVEELNTGGTRITVQGRPALTARDICVPADPSSAAFPVAAALLVPGSNVTLRGVCLNPTRTGLFQALDRMGAQITFLNERVEGGEPVADMHVVHSALQAITLEPEIVPSMVDEFPILAIAAANAEGTSRFEGLGELRVKESDRLAAIHAGLASIGVSAAIHGEALVIEGCGAGGVPGGNAARPVVTHFDHRIAMSFLIAGLASQQPIHVDDGRAVATSFPNFFALFGALGATIVG